MKKKGILSSIPRQLALLLIVISSFFAVSLYTIADQVLLAGFRLRETRMLSLDIERINSLFLERQRSLEERATDNGGRDSTYHFVKNPSQQFVDEIFSPLSFAITQVDIVCLLRFDGSVIYGGVLKDNKVVPLNQEYQKAFKEAVPYLTPMTALGAKGGILVIGDKRYLLGAGKIQKSSHDNAESLGLYIFLALS